MILRHDARIVPLRRQAKVVDASLRHPLLLAEIRSSTFVVRMLGEKT